MKTRRTKASKKKVDDGDGDGNNGEDPNDRNQENMNCSLPKRYKTTANDRAARSLERTAKSPPMHFAPSSTKDVLSPVLPKTMFASKSNNSKRKKKRETKPKKSDDNKKKEPKKKKPAAAATKIITAVTKLDGSAANDDDSKKEKKQVDSEAERKEPNKNEAATKHDDTSIIKEKKKVTFETDDESNKEKKKRTETKIDSNVSNDEVGDSIKKNEKKISEIITIKSKGDDDVNETKETLLRTEDSAGDFKNNEKIRHDNGGMDSTKLTVVENDDNDGTNKKHKVKTHDNNDDDVDNKDQNKKVEAKVLIKDHTTSKLPTIEEDKKDVNDNDNDDDVDNNDQSKKVEAKVEEDKKDENEDDDIGDKDKNKRKANTGKNDIVPKKRKKDFHGLEIELPKLFNETSDSVVLETLAKIDDVISSPLKYLRNGKTISNVDVLSFPYKRTYTDELDVRVVTRDPTETLPKSKLFGGYSLIDTATQITFQEFNKSDKSWLPLPSGFFECAARYKYTKGKGIVNEQLNIISNLGDNNLLDYEVIDMVVWHGGHFSRAFIINPSKVIEGFKVEYCDVDEFIPCILYANSLDDTSWHCKRKVCATIIKVLNEYCSEHDICRGTRLFNKKVLPIYSIQSKSNVCDIQIIFNSYTHYIHFSCRFIVPKQTDLWSCAYQTLLSRYHVMKTIKELGGGLTKNDLEDIPRDDEEDTVVLSERFKSYSASDAYIIRTDIRKVLSNLLPIERTGVNDGLSSSSTTMNEDNCFDLLGEDKDVTLVRPFKPLPEPKKKKRESATETRTNGRSIRDENKAKEQKIREEKQSKRIGRFDGRMEKGQHKRLKTAIRRDRKVPERRVGEPAATLDTYHDAAHRKALYHYGNRTIEYDRMCNFGTAEANATMKKSTAFGVIHNPISQYPDGVGQNFMPYRLDPQRLLISTKPRNELWKIVQDLHQNFDDYVVTSDVYNLDEAVVGNNRKYDIIDLVQRKGKSTDPQDMEDNKEALNNVKVVETKKNEDSDDTHMKEKVEKQEF